MTLLIIKSQLASSLTMIQEMWNTVNSCTYRSFVFLLSTVRFALSVFYINLPESNNFELVAPKMTKQL